MMFQSWCALTFLHWRYPVEAIRPLVPQPLEIDTFDGSAWVGITPFILRTLRPPLSPPLPWLSTFPETNCRTYVRAPDGSTGVWFFSLDAARAPAVAAARFAYGLPYAWSRMRVTIDPGWVRYRSVRLWPNAAETAIDVRPGAPIEQHDLEIFLTARYRLYSVLCRKLAYAGVEHHPWPLHSAEPASLRQTLTSAAGLPKPDGPPLAHYSPGVRVRIGRPKLLRLP